MDAMTNISYLRYSSNSSTYIGMPSMVLNPVKAKPSPYKTMERINFLIEGTTRTDSDYVTIDIFHIHSIEWIYCQQLQLKIRSKILVLVYRVLWLFICDVFSQGSILLYVHIHKLCMLKFTLAFHFQFFTCTDFISFIIQSFINISLEGLSHYTLIHTR